MSESRLESETTVDSAGEPASPEPAAGPGSAAVEHARREVNGVALHYVEAGPREADALVLLHGFPQTWLTWRLIITRLAERYHVVAPDLRGYGDSAKPPGQQGYDKGTMAADLYALAQTLGLRRPLLIGHDRGARVARRYALDHPDALAGAALLDILPVEWIYDTLTAAEVAEKYWHWVFHLVPELPERLIAGHEAEYLAFLFERAPGLLPRLRADGSWDAYLRAFLQPGAVAAFLCDYRATYALDVPRYRAERAAGQRVMAPLLLLWGERGNLGGYPVLDIWREVAATVRGQALADCGHYLPEERPEEVAAHLLRFAEICFEGA